MTNFNDEENQITEALFLALSDPHVIQFDVSRRIRLDKIAASTGRPLDQVRGVISKFRDPGRNFVAKLPALHEDAVEVGHESLFRLWSLFQEWKRRRQITSGSQTNNGEHARTFDVFLSYNSKDTAEVLPIAKQLKGQGIRVWLDKWEIPPGSSIWDVINEQIPIVRTAAVFYGVGIGPWHAKEEAALFNQSTKRGCPVIPVILESCKTEPAKLIPPMLQQTRYVDFRDKAANPMDELVWGITGKLPISAGT